MKGLFISFEGPEGSGKSTHCKLLFEALTRNCVETIMVREPGGTKISEEIRKILKAEYQDEKISNLTELFLFEAARAQLVEQVIIPALEGGKVVLCDRFADSTVAYQGYGRGLDLNFLFQLNRIATKSLEPDITFLLDIHPIEGFRRVQTRDSKDRIESENLDFHIRIRDGYKELAKVFAYRFRILDSSKSEEEVHKMILDVVEDALRNRR